MTIFTIEFWTAAGERAIRAAAAAALSTIVVGDGILNAITVDWPQAGGIALGGAVVSLLTSVVAGVVAPASGPSLGTEVPKGAVAAQANPETTAALEAGPAAPGIPEGAPVDIVPDDANGGQPLDVEEP